MREGRILAEGVEALKHELKECFELLEVIRLVDDLCDTSQ